MTRLFIFALCCTAVYYVIARAAITRWLWEPLEGTFLGTMLGCPACTGTWIGAALGHVVPLAPHAHGPWACTTATLLHAACGMVLTAICWAVMKLALDYGGIHEEEEEAPDGEAHRDTDTQG